MNEAITKLQAKRWLSPDPKCDFCGVKPDMQGTFFVDGATTMGPWALMCSDHYHKYGVGLGLGKGQMYNSHKPYYKIDG